MAEHSGLPFMKGNDQDGYEPNEVKRAPGKIEAADRYQVDRAHAWLVQLYKDWGKPEEAAALLFGL